MENAANALKMAAAILIFIIALACSFSLFGTAKQTADSIIGMRDKQKYLEAAELEGVLYTTSSSVTADGTQFDERGNRIVTASDVFSTIYRYSIERYGVTIIDKNGNVKARFDSITETNYFNNWDSRSTEEQDAIAEKIKSNLSNNYVTVNLNRHSLEDLYKLTNENNQISHQAIWYGSPEDINKRINADIVGKDFPKAGLKYEGKNLYNLLNGKTIVEVTNEIDNSKYLEDSSLLQQYNMPTVEIIYIVY